MNDKYNYKTIYTLSLIHIYRKRGDDRGTGLPEGPATTYTLLPVGKIHPQLYAQDVYKRQGGYLRR